MTNDSRLKPAAELAKHNRRFPGESEEYRKARSALLAEEIELRRHIERVAAQRRTLPPGGEVPEDYRFEGEQGPARLSELFGDKQTLVTYNWMFGPERERPCPMCTSLLSALDGEMPDILQRVAFAVVGRSPIERLKAFKKERGWRHLKIYSSAGNDFNRAMRTRSPERRRQCRLQRLHSRRRRDPPFLGRRDGYGERRPRTGPARRAGPDADLDDPRHDARGTRRRLVSEAGVRPVSGVETRQCLPQFSERRVSMAINNVLAGVAVKELALGGSLVRATSWTRHRQSTDARGG